MPVGSIAAQHYQQSEPGRCLPACVRMVLAALGAEHTEDRIARLLGSYEFGTPASRVTRLMQWGYQVQYGATSLQTLKNALARGLFPIIFVRADLLPWTDFSGFHAMVLTEVTDTEVTLLDPALSNGPTHLSLTAFLLAWEEFDCLAAVVSS